MHLGAEVSVAEEAQPSWEQTLRARLGHRRGKHSRREAQLSKTPERRFGSNASCSSHIKGTLYPHRRGPVSGRAGRTRWRMSDARTLSTWTLGEPEMFLYQAFFPVKDVSRRDES